MNSEFSEIDLTGLVPADPKPMDLRVQLGTEEMATFHAISEGWKVSGSDLAGFLLREALDRIARIAGSECPRRIDRGAEDFMHRNGRDRCCCRAAPLVQD